jgi:uncharacterized membrane protein YhaH (DUF805 family)
MLKDYYLSFHGRCDRMQYWIYGVLPYALLWVVIIFLSRLLNLSVYFTYPILVISHWPLITMQAKRYHDLNMSGWFTLLNLLPFVGKFLIVVIGLIPAQAGNNQYGPNAQRSPAVVAEPVVLSQTIVWVLFVAGLLVYFIYAALTGFDEFKIRGGNEERWMLWRFVVMFVWVTIAVFIYLARGRQAYLPSLLSSLIIGGVLLLFVLSLVVSGQMTMVWFGTALTHAFITGMLCMHFRNPVVAFVCSIVFIAAQIVADAFVFTVAGNLYLH